MSLSDPIGDMLTRIRNGQRAMKSSVSSPSSKLRLSVLEALKREGYIRGYDVTEPEKGKPEVSIELKYYQGKGVIEHVSRVSKPGRRVYKGVKDLPTIRNGLGVAILSTPNGVLSDNEARDANVGGEVLCKLY
ncbi:30S ribosomal protein S8 [uncultured Sneathiella sp.]|mgnify:FL=1|jgi:small subunit ribosomal protein S8|uniref:30S ribosomal protein S8 n=1 Tax=uncultured Sneathiella sp. TaxID=879315 RepID=UPI0030DBA98F|tara:strand:+ start:526 stop:924 length:399 start_codon:yes stop_codon:yes gene_type:complete